MGTRVWRRESRWPSRGSRGSSRRVVAWSVRPSLGSTPAHSPAGGRRGTVRPGLRPTPGATPAGQRLVSRRTRATRNALSPLPASGLAAGCRSSRPPSDLRSPRSALRLVEVVRGAAVLDPRPEQLPSRRPALLVGHPDAARIDRTCGRVRAPRRSGARRRARRHAFAALAAPSAPRALESAASSRRYALELRPLGLDHLGRRVGRRTARSRASPPRGRPPCAGARSRPRASPAAFCRSGRTTASKIRCSSLRAERDLNAAAAERHAPPPARGRARPRRARVLVVRRRPGRDDQSLRSPGRCDQISSVTCGITGCRSASSRSSAASAVAIGGSSRSYSRGLIASAYQSQKSSNVRW